MAACIQAAGFGGICPKGVDSEISSSTSVMSAGTFVYVRDPDVVRETTGRSKGTTVLALGAAPGEAFTPSEWELKHVQ